MHCLHPPTPIGDQDRISPYHIKTISTRQVIRIKKKYQLRDWLLIQYQILQTNIIEIVWQTVRRINNGILDHVLDCLEKSLYPNQTFNYLCQNIINWELKKWWDFIFLLCFTSVKFFWLRWCNLMHNLESEKRNDYLEKALKDKSLILLPKKLYKPYTFEGKLMCSYTEIWNKIMIESVFHWLHPGIRKKIIGK